MIPEILAKLGIRSIDDLTPAERATWGEWTKVLAKGDVTIDDLKTFLPKELERANIELRKHENSKEKDAYYKAYCSILDTITKAIVSPTQDREKLKAFLKQKYGLQ
jgi:hypothetical protein